MPSPPRISRSEWEILLILAAIQFTNILDFVIVMPLAPSLKADLGIDSKQFGWFVASYGFASFIGTVFAARLWDRFGRKRALLTLYLGFALSTLYCGVSPNFTAIITARAAAGLFGGVLGAAVMAVVGDVFADARRGTAMGVIMSSFAIASIAGVPLGLMLAERWNTQAPFTILAFLSMVIWGMAAFFLPQLKDHIVKDRRSPSMMELIFVPSHLKAFVFTTALVFGSFMVVPFLADAMVANAGMVKENVKYIYLAAGLATFVSTIIIGRLSDRYSKRLMYSVIAGIAVVMSIVVTNLTEVSLTNALLACTGFMVFTSGRMVPGQALITGCALPTVRGGFLSLNTAVQSAAMGAASVLSGSLISNDESGKLVGYSTVGLIAAGCALVSIVLANQLKVVDSTPLAGPNAGLSTVPAGAPAEIAVKGETML